MRHVQERLQHLFIAQRLHFVQKERQNNRRGKIKDDIHQRKDERIGQIPRPRGRFEEVTEPLQPHPLAAEHAGKRHIVFKRHHNAPHGQVFENEEIDNARNQQQIQPFIAPYIHAQPPPVFAACSMQRPDALRLRPVHARSSSRISSVSIRKVSPWPYAVGVTIIFL